MTNDNRMDVFDVIRKYVADTQYVVIPKVKTREELAGKYTQEETDASLTVLQLNGLISIGFTDAECYCLALTQKGIRASDLREEAKKREEERLAAEESKKAEERGKETPPPHPEEEPAPAPVAQTSAITKKEKIFLALLCGGSAFLGALIAGVITMAVVIAKVG